METKIIYAKFSVPLVNTNKMISALSVPTDNIVLTVTYLIVKTVKAWLYVKEIIWE